MFNKESSVVRAWVRAIERGDKNVEEVPELYNLRDVVISIIEGDE